MHSSTFLPLAFVSLLFVSLLAGGGEGHAGLHRHSPTPLPLWPCRCLWGCEQEAAQQHTGIGVTRESMGWAGLSSSPPFSHSHFCLLECLAVYKPASLYASSPVPPAALLLSLPPFSALYQARQDSNTTTAEQQSGKAGMRAAVEGSHPVVLQLPCARPHTIRSHAFTSHATS
ncbi:unnamed protein product [Closterium sp. NIES-65]|nr:unnamed protein product [Closterium sp. NIES-65]